MAEVTTPYVTPLTASAISIGVVRADRHLAKITRSIVQHQLPSRHEPLRQDKSEQPPPQ